MRIIDIHQHIWERKSDYIERLVDECGRLKIWKVCLSALGPLFNQPDNEEVKKAFTKYPDLIIGFGYVRLGRDKANIVDKLYKEGFKGLKVTAPTKNYDDKEFYPIYEKAEKYRMPILFHTGILLRTYDKYYDVSSARMMPIYLDAIARAFPCLNIIGAHLGISWYEEASALMRIHPNVYFDLTGASRYSWRSNKKPGFFKNLLFWPGAFNKVLFGTDVAIEEMKEAIKIYHGILNPINLPKNILENIYCNTADKLLGLIK